MVHHYFASNVKQAVNHSVVSLVDIIVFMSTVHHWHKMNKMIPILTDLPGNFRGTVLSL